MENGNGNHHGKLFLKNMINPVELVIWKQKTERRLTLPRKIPITPVKHIIYS